MGAWVVDILELVIAVAVEAKKERKKKKKQSIVLYLLSDKYLWQLRRLRLKILVLMTATLSSCCNKWVNERRRGGPRRREKRQREANRRQGRERLSE